MEMYESMSRALMRRKYRRIETGSGFAMSHKRLKVAHLHADRRRSVAHRLRLRLKAPGRLLACLKAACGRVVQQVGTKGSKKAIEEPEPVLYLPKSLQLRSSNNDVMNQAWFQQALRRSVAEGRLQI